MTHTNLKLSDSRSSQEPETEAGLPKGLQVVRPVQPQLVASTGNQTATNQQVGQGIVPLDGGPHNGAGKHVLVQAVQNSPQFDDEISTFFKNRQMVMQGSTDMHPFVKFILLIGVLIGGYIIAWNYVPKVRVKSDEFAQKYIQMPVAEFMPAWTTKSKSYVNHSAQVALGKVTSKQQKIINGPIDPMHLAVISGAWGQVDAFISMKCTKWTKSSACGVRAWYLAYRGMKSSLKPLQTMDFAHSQELSKRDLAVFLYAKSTVFDGAASDQIFNEALNVAKDDKEVRRMIFDARFKSIIRENRPGEIGGMIKMIPKIGATPQDVGKWRALEMASRFSKDNLNVKSQAKINAMSQLSELLKKHAGSFAGDPVGFLLLANSSIKLGIANQIAPMTSSFAQSTGSLKLDPALKRDILIINARTAMILGQLNQAAELLSGLQKKEGLDAVSSHILASLFVEMRNSGRMTEAEALFAKADRTLTNWQSQYGRLIALVRLNRLKDANKLAGELIRSKNSNNETWISLAINEYKFALAGASGDMAVARYQEVAKNLQVLHLKHPDWQGIAKLYAEALAKSNQVEMSQQIRMKIDDLASKTSYLSSTEYMESPIGPFALMR